MRTLNWFNSADTEAWVCSECAWVFKPLGPPVGKTLEEMKENFERQREKEFAAHVCAEHQKTKSQRR
jgi:rubredoxin